MRIRSIKPEFWRSDDIAALSWGDRLLFIGLLTYVDDTGSGDGNPATIAANIFPLDDPETTTELVRNGLRHLAQAGLVKTYTAEDGDTIVRVSHWDGHGWNPAI